MNEFRTCYGYDDIFLVPRYSEIMSRSDCDTSKMLGSEKYQLPIIMAPMDTVTSAEMIRFALNTNYIVPTLHRYFMNVDAQIEFLTSVDLNWEWKKIWVSVGSSLREEGKNWIDRLYSIGIRKFICDIANGHSKHAIETTKYIKSLDGTNVIAGAVCTADGFCKLQDVMGEGDMIRIGLGSGQICCTSTQTSFGVPQVTSLIDCVKVRKNGILIIADGNIKGSGEIAKAIALGADFVMCGKLLAATSLSDAVCYDSDKFLTNETENIKYKRYYGMASLEARRTVGMKRTSIEGVCGLIPYTGNTENVLEDIKMNLQSSLSYAGCSSWEGFNTVEKVIVSHAGLQEKLTHLIKL